MASRTEEAQTARTRLASVYGDPSAEEADAIVALGGDGLMLEALHRFMNTGKPIYGMNRGSVGFLMNEFREEGLLERLCQGDITALRPLKMEATDIHGALHIAHAFNEVSLLRELHQAAKLRISIDGRIRLEELICDGILVATPAGSNRLQSLGPRADPADQRPIAGADLDQRLPPAALARRPALAGGAGHDRGPGDREAPRRGGGRSPRDPLVRRVDIYEDPVCTGLVMFDADHSWEERNLAEQFRY